MSPEELRTFRESLGLSRKEFAPKLHISEPTLERWERGQSGPRDIHLHILRQMKEHLDAGHSITYFQYDTIEKPEDSPDDIRHIISGALKAVGILLYREQRDRESETWTLTFTVGWTWGEPIETSLVCEGSFKSERPAIDFTMTIACGKNDFSDAMNELAPICFDHGISWQSFTDKRRSGLMLRQRLFNTACNPATVQHLLGNYRSCFNKLKNLMERPKGSRRMAPVM
jgi:transcriptional regulator with XRE-family HTH domain